MRSLEEVLAELNAAEKEYAKKCREYGIEEKGKNQKDAPDGVNDKEKTEK